MELYFSPLACSLASRIALYEASAEAQYVLVEGKPKRLPGGRDYEEINPLGLVPALRTDDGTIITENAAVLQWIADQYPQARLAPAERTRLHQWLCFIGTELHKGLFTSLVDPNAPEGAKQYSLEKGLPRLAFVARYLAGRSFLLDEFSVADAYLFTVINWGFVTPVGLDRLTNLRDYRARLAERPSIAKAFAEELELYRAEKSKERAASATSSASTP